MGHSIRSKVKRKFRAIKREKIAAKQAAAKEAKKEGKLGLCDWDLKRRRPVPRRIILTACWWLPAEIVRNAMEGVEQSGVATMGQEPPANVLANESTLSKVGGKTRCP